MITCLCTHIFENATEFEFEFEFYKKKHYV